MAPDRAALWDAIRTFDIDGEPRALTFEARLARENGWSAAFARRAVLEYRRFVFLAATGAPVCPSEAVDAVWHLHLTYTRSYWERFCGEVFGKPLHHEPTKGGAVEGAKYRAMYAVALARYREAFGEAPPADIWPSADQRFGNAGRCLTVNTTRNWVVPKAPVRRFATVALVAAVLLATGAGCAAATEHFAAHGFRFQPEGLWLLAGVPVFVALRLWLARLRYGPQRRAAEVPDLDWVALTALPGTPERTATAALARLVGRGVAELSADGRTLAATGFEPPDLHPVERAALAALPVTNDPKSLEAVTAAVTPPVKAVRAELAARGLLANYLKQRDVIEWGIMLLLAVPFIGLVIAAAVWGGAPLEERLRAPWSPIGFALGVWLGAFAGFALDGGGPLSRLGAAARARATDRHTGTADAGLAVALFGTAGLASVPGAPLADWFPTRTGAHDTGCGVRDTSGCGSTGCG